MIFSRLILNPHSSQVRHELADPYELHRTICRAFPDMVFKDNEPSGILFRLDVHPHTGIPTLLVQSHQQPDWSFLVAPEKNYLLSLAECPPGVTENPAVKILSLQIQPGQNLMFRLRANPTKRLGKDKGDNYHKRVGIFSEDDQLKWLERKVAMAGAVLLSARVCNEERTKGKLFIEKEDEKRMRFLSVQFDGILQVKDPAQLLAAVQAGVGSGKGLGFGLLSLAPARG